VDDIIEELSWRGLIAVNTDLDELRLALKSGRVTYYAGFDPTAPGLHIGHLALLLTMRRLQLAGHRPVGLVGGATGLIGDPSGKSAERVLNPREVVAEWVERIRGEVARFLDFDAGESSALIVSNLEWTEPMTALEFLRDIGKHFSVNRMLDRESVKARLEAGGISYTEFSYQLLQAMDFLELYRRYGCILQLGGSDQWGNLVAGVGLIRSVESGSAHALAIPLITKPDGTKYGKTEGGAIWLSADLMSPYAFYQFWLNVTDAEVPNLLRVFSFRSREEIDELLRESTDRPARAGRRGHHAGTRRQGDRGGDRGQPGPVRPGVPDRSRRAHAGRGGRRGEGGRDPRHRRASPGRQPDGGGGRRADRLGGSPCHRRGWRLPEQPEGHRREGGPGCRRFAARPVPGPPPGQAHGRRGRGRPGRLAVVRWIKAAQR
jgi:tyrosyl-tRNA synthetase